MRQILIVGIGTGNPEHITIEAINALNSADVLFVPTKGEKKAELADVRRDIISRYVTNPRSRTVDYAIPTRNSADKTYVQGVDSWHAAISKIYADLFMDELGENGIGAFLVWGDPMLYDSTIRIIERVKSAKIVPFDFRVLPGITSIQALCASHRIPLNLVGKPIEVTTGRRAKESFPDKSQTSVVMLDGEQAFMTIDDADAEIFWGAYLGTDDELIIAGNLLQKRDEILKVRAEARKRHGWIMDIYLLRKGVDFDEL